MSLPSEIPHSRIATTTKHYVPQRNGKFEEVIDTRVALGWKKYGQSLDDNVKTGRQKAVHLIQELLDSLQYIWWSEMSRSFKIRRSEQIYDMLLEIDEAYPDLTVEEMLYKEGFQE